MLCQSMFITRALTVSTAPRETGHQKSTETGRGNSRTIVKSCSDVLDARLLIIWREFRAFMSREVLMAQRGFGISVMLRRKGVR